MHLTRKANAESPSTLQLERIARSRQRSAAFGLRETDRPDFGAVSRASLGALIEAHHKLYAHAVPVMETLYEQILNTHSMVLLTDPEGMILHALGDDDFLERADKVALRPGVAWSERSKGTNAIGTALAEGVPTVVHADQHFLRVNHFLTCSCAPIIDPGGRVIGALDVTGDQRSQHQHTMALVRMSAQMIENHLFADTFPEAVRIHFHSRPEFIGTLMEGIAAFTAAGRFLSANRSAQFQLGMSQPALQSHSFDSLFGMGMEQLFDHYRRASPARVRCVLPSGVGVHLRAEFGTPSTLFAGISPSAPEARDPVRREAQAPAVEVPEAEQVRAATAQQPASLKAVEQSAISAALARHDGNVSAAARELGVSRNTIYRKLGKSAQARPVPPGE